MKPTRLALLTVLLLAPGLARAIGPEVRRATSPNRPYIVEIGEPRPLDSWALDQERKANSDLRGYLDQFGWPDYAEMQAIEPEWPWAAYEVRVYYLERDIEIAFGRAFIAPSVTDFGLIRHQGRIEPGTRDRIVALVGTPRIAVEAPEPVEMRPVVVAAAPPPSDFELLVQRVEAAADRAAVAADRAAAASDAASAAADRTATILDKLSQ